MKPLVFIALLIVLAVWAYYSYSASQSSHEMTTAQLPLDKCVTLRTKGIMSLDPATSLYHVVFTVTVTNNCPLELHVQKSIGVLANVTLDNGLIQPVNQQQTDATKWTLSEGGSYELTMEFNLNKKPTNAKMIFYVYFQEREEPVWVGLNVDFTE